eukprot:NODE_6119_length_1703_cov_15.864848.p1 GENE.NODE_6119_length_1703_cov_15.864848~~NODE_6119_length_1703_cov_15.864848.p1  ORF type:complete len:438 (-),score=85.49 NODE_6119_length_1703_cov_15.864848:339-1652(-)
MSEYIIDTTLSEPEYALNAQTLISEELIQRRFTFCNSMCHVLRASSTWPLVYIPWAASCFFMEAHNASLMNKLRMDLVVKVITFLLGIVVSLTLRESLDRYRRCFEALVDFSNEFRSFWYFVLMQLTDQHAARIIFNMHMTAFSVSALQIIHRYGDKQDVRASSLVQEEFRQCVLFDGKSIYTNMCSNPTYSELLLESWLRAMGLLDWDTFLRWSWARNKLQTLLSEQQVHPLATGSTIVRFVIHVFLVTLPLGSSSISIKVMTPIVCVMFIGLIEITNQIDSPFGYDTYDIPWPMLLGTAKYCKLSAESKVMVKRVIDFFNHGVTTSRWDAAVAQELFGKDVKVERCHLRGRVDNGEMHLGIYPVAELLRNVDVLGHTSIIDRDCLLPRPAPLAPRTIAPVLMTESDHSTTVSMSDGYQAMSMAARSVPIQSRGLE